VPATAERRRERGRRTSPLDEIVRAATDLFSRKGFHATTTQELADAVGLVKGTLYYHIGNKERLLFRIHQEVTEDGIRRWSALAAQQLPAAETLRLMIVEHCRVMDRYRDAVAIFSEEMKHLSPALRRRLVARRDVYHGLLESTISRGVEAGELRTPNPRLATLTILGMLNGMYRWYRPGGRLKPEQVGEVFADLVLTGLAV
jgi:TetR/AcrR family transcriptional regulator, cholesterol catabolism regulator